MRAAAVPASWLAEEGVRFDARPYVSGARAAQKKLRAIANTRLEELTHGFRGGIFTHLFSPSRTYVEDVDYGVPFLGSAEMLRQDLGQLPLLSRRDAFSRSYLPLRIEEGMTLISCSGTTGRMVFARSDMTGMWASGHIMKVRPDPDKVPPGYVFAFLSGRFGVPMVTGSTYGTIVQHIERQHVAELPVPRFSQRVEQVAHELVEAAATKRVQAVQLLQDARSRVYSLIEPRQAEESKTFEARSSQLQSRMDAYYYSPKCLAARQSYDQASCPIAPLGEIADVFIPGIFKRKYAPDPQYGRPYLTGADVFQLAPLADRYLTRAVVEEYNLLVREGMILIQEAGQLGGLIGRSVFVGRRLAGAAVSNNMVRLSTVDIVDAGYLFAILDTREGVVLLSREASGSSIPHTDLGRLRRMNVPWPEYAVRSSIGKLVCSATLLRDEACVLEDEARVLVECAIEEAT
jgi:type I restriction enzyme S subunit